MRILFFCVLLVFLFAVAIKKDKFLRLSSILGIFYLFGLFAFTFTII